MTDEADTPSIRVVAAAIVNEGRYLITQRRSAALLPLLWEFPGGRVEPGESDAAALVREVRHRVGVDVEVKGLISYVRHGYERYTVDLYLYDCALPVDCKPKAERVAAFAWATSDEFSGYPFTPADEVSVARLLGV